MSEPWAGGDDGESTTDNRGGPFHDILFPAEKPPAEAPEAPAEATTTEEDEDKVLICSPCSKATVSWPKTQKDILKMAQKRRQKAAAKRYKRRQRNKEARHEAVRTEVERLEEEKQKERATAWAAREAIVTAGIAKYRAAADIQVAWRAPVLRSRRARKVARNAVLAQVVSHARERLRVHREVELEKEIVALAKARVEEMMAPRRLKLREAMQARAEAKTVKEAKMAKAAMLVELVHTFAKAVEDAANAKAAAERRAAKEVKLEETARVAKKAMLVELVQKFAKAAAEAKAAKEANLEKTTRAAKGAMLVELAQKFAKADADLRAAKEAKLEETISEAKKAMSVQLAETIAKTVENVAEAPRAAEVPVSSAREECATAHKSSDLASPSSAMPPSPTRSKAAQKLVNKRRLRRAERQRKRRQRRKDEKREAAKLEAERVAEKARKARQNAEEALVVEAKEVAHRRKSAAARLKAWQEEQNAWAEEHRAAIESFKRAVSAIQASWRSKRRMMARTRLIKVVALHRLEVESAKRAKQEQEAKAAEQARVIQAVKTVAEEAVAAAIAKADEKATAEREALDNRLTEAVTEHVESRICAQETTEVPAQEAAHTVAKEAGQEAKLAELAAQAAKMAAEAREAKFATFRHLLPSPPSLKCVNAQKKADDGMTQSSAWSGVGTADYMHRYETEECTLASMLNTLKGLLLEAGVASIRGGVDRLAEEFAVVCGFPIAFGPLLLKRATTPGINGLCYKGRECEMPYDYVWDSFVQYWAMEVSPFDSDERFFRLVRDRRGDCIRRADLHPFLEAQARRHADLVTLSHEQISVYLDTVAATIFSLYSRCGVIRLSDVRKSAGLVPAITHFLLWDVTKEVVGYTHGEKGPTLPLEIRQCVQRVWSFERFRKIRTDFLVLCGDDGWNMSVDALGGYRLDGTRAVGAFRAQRIMEAGVRPFAPGESPGGSTSSGAGTYGCSLDYDAFVAFFLCEEALLGGTCSEREVRYCFRVVDESGKGTVDVEDVARFLEGSKKPESTAGGREEETVDGLSVINEVTSQYLDALGVTQERQVFTLQDMVKPGNSERAGHFFEELFSGTDLHLKEYMNVAGIQIGSSGTSNTSNNSNNNSSSAATSYPSSSHLTRIVKASLLCHDAYPASKLELERELDEIMDPWKKWDSYCATSNNG